MTTHKTIIEIDDSPLIEVTYEGDLEVEGPEPNVGIFHSGFSATSAATSAKIGLLELTVDQLLLAMTSEDTPEAHKQAAEWLERLEDHASYQAEEDATEASQREPDER